jgi:hypothetical protein
MSNEQGQQLGIDMAHNFMLMTLFSIVADMADDPDALRSDVKKALLDLVEDYELKGVPLAIAGEARETAKRIISGILASAKPIKQ